MIAFLTRVTAIPHYAKAVWIFSLGIILLGLATWSSLRPVTDSLQHVVADAANVEITDRQGVPLSISYQNRWNSFDYLPLHDMPDLLVQAFILSEDRHFYEHHGVDWMALASAAWQDVRSFGHVRGASTITEQTVRILNERPRNLWSKWLESFEANRLEQQSSKAQILEFYCNEVPYAANRRGVVQAAHYYFNRDLTTLTAKELLALVVLARAPTDYDLYRNPTRIDAAIERLASKMAANNLLTADDLQTIQQTLLRLGTAQLPVDASRFVSYVRHHHQSTGVSTPIIRTTLDSSLQRDVENIMSERLKSLTKMKVGNAAAVVVDHRTNEILAWVVVGGKTGLDPNNKIDAVTVPRQPGSSMKPFLYTLALDRGWTPATLLNDAPMAEMVGSGLHDFKNYNHSFYGLISLREALGNSLNIPALRTINFVGVDQYLQTLHALGFQSLTQQADIYKDGLALGNGEVTLYEMVQGYAALAHGGIFRPLRFDRDELEEPIESQIFSPEAASLIGNILSDPWARRLEFGYGSVLNIPIQTAVKTGTSTDYRDAWTMGYDSRYVVGIWMGNLDQKPMDGVTGSLGPALALRSIFAELHQDQDTTPLYLSPKLVQKEICLSTDHDLKSDGSDCRYRSEYFIDGLENIPNDASEHSAIALARPTQGLQMAFDPRVPAGSQIFPFRIEGLADTCSGACQVDWYLNDKLLATTDDGIYRWQIARGKYDLRVQVIKDKQPVFTSGEIHFIVK